MTLSNIAVGKKLFEFTSESQWKNKATSWFANCGHMVNRTICIDTAGRVCANGCDFTRAYEDGAYPVSVYAIDSVEGDER